MRSGQALPAGGEDEQALGGMEIEAEEFADMAPLETESETESEGSEYVDLPPLEYEQYEQERGVRVPSALANQGGEEDQGPGPRVALLVHHCRYLGEVLASYALMQFEPLAPVLIPPRYEMLWILGPEEEVPDLPFVEQPLRATRNPRVWVMSGKPLRSTPVNESAEEPNSVSVDSYRWVSLPFGSAESPASVQRRIERGLYVGPIDLYRAEADCTFSYTQVAVRAGETPVAPAGYSILPESPQRVTGAAAELAAAVHGLTAAPPAQPDVSWEELPWAFMATAEAVATGEGEGAEHPDHWASMDRRWDRNMAAEGQGPEERFVPGCRRG
jgi:hypothetical protein